MTKVLDGRATEIKDAASDFGYKRADGLSMSTGNPEAGAYSRFHKGDVNFAQSSSVSTAFGEKPNAVDLKDGAKNAVGKVAGSTKNGIERVIRSINEKAKADIDEMEAEAQANSADAVAMRDADNASQSMSAQLEKWGNKLASSGGRGAKAAKLEAKAVRNEARSAMFAEKARLAAGKRDMSPGSGKRKGASFAERWYAGRSRIASFKSRMAEKGAERAATRFGRLKSAGKTLGASFSAARSGKIIAALAPAAVLFLLVAGLMTAASGLAYMFTAGSMAQTGDGGACIIIPEEYRGSVFTVTEYGTYGFANGAVARNSDCYPVWRQWMDGGHKYKNGIAAIDGYYLIACTEIFGSVGDRMIWEFEDGTQILCMMADTKNPADANCGVYGHQQENGSWNNLEFEVDTNWFNRLDRANPGSTRWLPEIAGKKPCKVYNLNRAPQGSAIAQKIIECAQSLLGTPYQLGADVGSGYVDCSGLTSYCYAQVGIPIPRSSEEQEKEAPQKFDDVSKAQPGDILWMHGHVGIYIGGGRTIEALSQGVVESKWDKFEKCLHWPQVSTGPANDVMTPKGQKIITAARQVGSPGGGLCAMWVSMVYQRALGYYPGGDARDMYDRLTSTDLTTLQPGMCVAVSTHPGTEMGSIYGHIGIYIGGGQVMDNAGYIRTMSLSEWNRYYSKSVPVRCGWL